MLDPHSPSRDLSSTADCQVMGRRGPDRRPFVVVADYEGAEEVAAPLRAYNDVQIVDSANEAVHVCATRRVDLVITRAVFFQGMNGVELVDALKALSCPPKVVLTTPFKLDILAVLPGFPPRAVPILRKPLDAKELIRIAEMAIWGEIHDEE